MSKTVLKINPFVAAIILAATCAGTAQAQSNVTIYGRVDAGLDFQSNQVGPNGTRGSAVTIGGNNWGTSMFGFKGVEDLGGGLKAIFTLENGFSANNGTTNGGPSRLWSRRSWVGLTGDFGTVKLGRDLTLPSDLVWSIDPTGQQNLSSATLAKGRNWPQTDNQIQYISPSFGGFVAQGSYGFGGVPGATKDKSTGGVALSYSQSNFTVLAMYDFMNNANGQYSSLYGDSINGTYGPSSQEITIGGTATFDKLKLFAAWQAITASKAVDTPYTRANQSWLGANYMLTPAWTLIGAAYYTKLNNDSGNAQLYMLGANYNLSKRTLLYGSVGTVRNKGQADFQVEVGSSAGMIAQNQNAIYTGISHSF
ncbi:porin [Glaciimonas soli]|uniref:Porin n=1 Tax=Glaciimonas soli TaxID=2590999 RepID=A0A843YPN3_9BURK|nr:porin [Glaciimonas soli]MQR01455.1 porin [Glaciimonas soli]